MLLNRSFLYSLTLIRNHLICQYDTSKFTRFLKVHKTLILLTLIDIPNDFQLMSNLIDMKMIYIIMSLNQMVDFVILISDKKL